MLRRFLVGSVIKSHEVKNNQPWGVVAMSRTQKQITMGLLKVILPKQIISHLWTHVYEVTYNVGIDGHVCGYIANPRWIGHNRRGRSVKSSQVGLIDIIDIPEIYSS